MLANAGWRFSTLNSDAQDALGTDIGNQYVRTRITEGMAESYREILTVDLKDTKFDSDDIEIYDPPLPIVVNGERMFLLRENGVTIMDETGDTWKWHPEKSTAEGQAQLNEDLEKMRSSSWAKKWLVGDEE